MQNINIKLQKQFLSLQEGFEWNNIPMFSVITGINGAGKTHLLKLLYESTTTLDLLNITDSRNDIFNLLLPNNNDLENRNTTSTKRNYIQFIAYFQSIDHRLGEDKQLQENILGYKGMVERSKESLKRIQGVSADKGTIINNEKELKRWESEVYSTKYKLSKLYDPIYEKEIKRISNLLDKNIEDLSIEEIKDNGKTTFDGVFEIDTIKQFIADELQDKHSTILKGFKSGEINQDKILAIKNKLESFQIINNLFNKYGFTYYKMDNPNPDIDNNRSDINITSDKIKLTFSGQKGEIVNYDDLSSGEKIIIKIIMLARSKNINGENINTIILDEPDAHLHPSLSKMMIEILEDLTKPIEEGGADLRVIITTHSPSTVAFAPQESLFLMNRDENGNRFIRTSSKDEAIRILSDGIFTFKEAVGKFEIISESTRNNILCVEGKTDVLHIETAMKKLDRNLDIEIINLHDAGTLASFVKTIPASILRNKKIIGLFDNDNEGRISSNDKNIKGNNIDGFKQITAEQSSGLAYVCCLPVPDISIEEYCPIEYLYPMNILNENGMLEKRNFHEFKNSYKSETTTTEKDNLLNEEYDKGTSLRVFKVNDSKKNKFSEDIEKLDPECFEGFNPLFNLLEKIIAYKNEN